MTDTITVKPANITQIIVAIASGDMDDHLVNIKRAVQERDEARAKELARSCKVGDRVRLVNISPKYLTGLTGEIVSKGRRTHVKLDAGQVGLNRGLGRYYSDDLIIKAHNETIAPA